MDHRDDPRPVRYCDRADGLKLLRENHRPVSNGWRAITAIKIQIKVEKVVRRQRF
jgi:hypothetical protein